MIILCVRVLLHMERWHIKYIKWLVATIVVSYQLPWLDTSSLLFAVVYAWYVHTLLYVTHIQFNAYRYVCV